MPKRHGLFFLHQRDASSQAVPPAATRHVRCGIRRVFTHLADAERGHIHARAEQRGQTRKPSADRLDSHFQTVFSRFLFACQELNCQAQELASAHAESSIVRLHAPTFRASYLADHLLTYLNTLIDDVAVLIARVTGVTVNLTRNSMAELIKSFPQNDSPVAKLIESAKEDDSWWNRGFKTKRGARQRLVHNQYFVQFQLSDGEVTASLISPNETPGDDNPVIAEEDFLDCVRSVLTSLFDWLDELEDALAEILQMPAPDGSRETYYPLPIGHPSGTTRYDPRYFVVPLCEDSDLLPLEITV